MHAYCTTETSGHACELARQAVDKRYTHVIAVGGDGTINEVVNGMLSSDHYDPAKICFTFLPCGSGNDLARTLRYNKLIISLRERIQRNTPLFIDVGVAQFENQARYFVNVMDLGIGACVAEKVQHYRRNRWSFLSYQRAIWNVLPFFQKLPLNISCNEFKYEGKALSVVVANGRWFGAGLGIAPDAKLDDRKLNVVVIGNVGIIEYLLHLPQMLRGKKIQHTEVHYFTTQSVQISGSTIHAELDGEPCGQTPVHVSISAHKLCVLQ